MHSYLNEFKPSSRSRELGSRPQFRSCEVEREHANDAQRAQPRQQACPLSHSQIDEQWARKEDAPACQRRSEEVVAGEQGGCVLWVRERDVDEDALHDDEDGGGVDGDTNDWGDPVDIRVRRPGKDEEADRRPKGADESRLEPVFLRSEAVFQNIGDKVEVKVGEVRGDTGATGYQDTQEDDTDCAEREAIHHRVDQRKNFEEGVIDAIDEAGIHVHEGDGWVFDCDLDRLDQRVYNHRGRVQALFVDFRLRTETIVARQFTQPGSAAQKDVGTRGLRYANEHDDKDGTGDPDNFPERPPPSFGFDRKTREEGAQRRSAVGRCHPKGESVREFEQRVHVLQRCATVGKTGATEESLEEAKNEETGEAVDYCGGNREDDEDGEGDDVDWAPSYPGDLAQRGKQ